MLTINDVSKLLAAPAETITRWANQGKIPSRSQDGEYIFVQKELEQWAYRRNLCLHYHRKKTDETAAQCAPPDLGQAMRNGRVFFEVPGQDMESVMVGAVNLAPLSDQVDRKLLIHKLMEREKLASTSVGGGVAIPHPRHQGEIICDQDMITTCFLQTPIDFKAIDDIPVFVIFLMLSPDTKTHLHLLSRLSFCLRTESFMSSLRRCADAASLFEQIEAMEALLNKD